MPQGQDSGVIIFSYVTEGFFYYYSPMSTMPAGGYFKVMLDLMKSPPFVCLNVRLLRERLMVHSLKEGLTPCQLSSSSNTRETQLFIKFSCQRQYWERGRRTNRRHNSCRESQCGVILVPLHEFIFFDFRSE